jgi:hypothetical protein
MSGNIPYAYQKVKVGSVVSWGGFFPKERQGIVKSKDKLGFLTVEYNGGIAIVAATDLISIDGEHCNQSIWRNFDEHI